MPTLLLSHRLPKRGNSEAECEDALALSVTPETATAAVADGASESSFAGLWARLLAEAFVRDPAAGLDPARWDEWLPPVQAAWSAEIGSKPLPWYAEEKVARGAFAALLGVAVSAGRWRAVAVGDACLFVVRGGGGDGRGGSVAAAFPVQSSAEFGNTPWLVGSRSRPAEMRSEGRFATASGEARPGDRLWLLSDAAAAWWLAVAESGGRPWETLAGLADPAAFAAWVDSVRDSRAMKNDDVTAVCIEA
jgi:hypothetical protein